MKVKLNKYLADYELIDCGNRKKIERFGDKILIRPEISADFSPVKKYSEWEEIADATFSETEKSWEIHKQGKFDEWFIDVEGLKIKLQLTNFKHVGIFPEQVFNWNYIKDVSNMFNGVPRFLNLFGYTGISSMCAAGCNYDVTHVEGLKQIVKWGSSLAENNGIVNIRWIVDDAVKFVERELRRENKYDLIMLDPPAIGYGKSGKRWVFEKDIDNLLASVRKLLKPKSVVILNLYAQSMNEKFGHKMILEYFNDFRIETFEKTLGVSSKDNFISHGYMIRLERGINSAQKQ